MNAYAEDDMEAAAQAINAGLNGGDDNEYFLAAAAPGIAARALRDAADDYYVNLSAMSGRQIRQWLLDRADTIEDVA